MAQSFFRHCTTSQIQYPNPISKHNYPSLNKMFGALNRFISRLDSDSPSRDSDSHGAFGFQVLRNKNDDIPIEPWFDFIIGINGRQIVSNSHPTSQSYPDRCDIG